MLKPPKTRADKVLYSKTVKKSEKCQFVIEIRAFRDMRTLQKAFTLSIVEQREVKNGQKERTFSLPVDILQGFQAAISEAVSVFQGVNHAN